MKKARLASVIVILVMIATLFLSACGTPTDSPAADTGTSTATSAPPAAQTSSGGAALGGQSETMKAEDMGETENGYSPDASGLDFKESPLSASKGLPPVAERLPKNPKIANHIPTRLMTTEIGTYGGTLNTIRMDPVWDAVMWTGAAQTLVNTPGRFGEEFTPSLLESYEVNEDFTEYTLKFREGTRWSDGTLVTMEDVRYTFYDDLCNAELNPNTNSLIRAGGNPGGDVAEFEIIDDYTWKLKFTSRYGGFILRMCFTDYNNFFLPSDHMKQYHIDYGDPDFIKAELAARSYTDVEWYNLYKFVRLDTWNTGRDTQLTTPTLAPWVHITDGEPRIYERNHYYWKVDREGNQLPYFDYVSSTFVTDIEAAGVKLLAGEIDFGYEWIPLNKIALYKDNEEKGGYRILTDTMLHRTDADLFLNMTFEDETWRLVTRDIRFRKALSLAIDREDIVDTVFLGFAHVSDIQDPTFDLDAANALLDEMGMTRGPDGYRLAPNGEKFVMDFNYNNKYSQFVPTCTLVNEQWAMLDLNVNFKMMEESLSNNMVTANEAQITVAFEHGPVTAMFDDWGFNRWGRLWNLYRETQGREGEEQPDWVRDFYETVYAIRTEPPRDIANLRQTMRDLVRENIYMIIPVEGITQCSLINKDLKNFPNGGFLISTSFACDEWFKAQ